LAGLPAALAAGALSGVATALAFPPHDVGLLAFFSLIPILVPVLFLSLHLGVALVQTFIFVMLTLVYLGQAHDSH